MSDVGFLFDEVYLRHDPGAGHPESPTRLMAIQEALSTSGVFTRWHRVEPRAARLEELKLVHHPAVLERVQIASQNAPAYLDPDTVVSSESCHAALLAAGGVLECIDAICAGRIRRAFAFVRPPGHHAEPNKSMGFCLFNNTAIAAAYARTAQQLERVAIVDFDVHHGNGTQAAFYDNPHVLFLSSHQYPFYPGTGYFDEIGIGNGRGYTVNFPLPAGAGDRTFVPIYTHIFAPILQQYQPQIIVVSAGFDAHIMDPIGELSVTTAGFTQVVASLIQAAESSCQGKICFVLEGGYNLDALEACTRAAIAAMEAMTTEEPQLPDDRLFEHLSQRVKKETGDLWKW